MKNSNINSDKINMAKNISKAISENDEQALKSVGLSEEKMSALMGILNNEDMIQKIIQSEDAQALLKKLGKE